jgi:glycosyltransferase involved in cell wall biosynthesis
VSAEARERSSRSVAMFLPSLDGGGAERVFVELANEFAALGLRVDLLLAAVQGPYLEEVDSRVTIIDLRAGRVMRSLLPLVRYLREASPWVLIAGLDHANIVALLSTLAAGGGTRCVLSVRSVPSAVHREQPSVRSWLLLQLSRAAYRFADAVIVNSHAAASEVARKAGAARERVRVIYNPLDTVALSRLSEGPVPHPWVAPGAPPLILSVGSLSALKDFPTLIGAFAQLRSQRECRLVILGEGPERARLERLVRELHLEADVHLPGFVRNPFTWMSRAAVFVSSSVTEGCPNALMQAMACGARVVSTDCPGGSGEILEGGVWGRLVPVGDAAAMAYAIADVIDAPVHPDTRRRASAFELRSVARQYLQVLLPDWSAPGQAC